MKTAIIDLASMFHRLWNIDRENVERKITSFLKTLQYDNIIVAIDAPPYKRKDIYPQYKANRDVPEPDLVGCYKTIKSKILSEGFKIASAEGWEADDVIATIINEMTDKGEYNPEDVVVYGSDKDLLQVTKLTDPFTNECKSAEEKLGVKPYQVPDYLALIGDKSDNVPHPEGVGPTTAVGLLNSFNNIEGIIEAIEKTPEKFTKPAIFKSLSEGKEIMRSSLQLVLLNHNVSVEYHSEEKKPIDIEKEEIPVQEVSSQTPEVKPEVKTDQPKQTENAVILRTEPVEYRRSLEPVGIQECWKVAAIFDRSGMYPQFKGPEQMMMVIMRGRELGLGALASLELIEMIQGKPAMRAAGMSALCMQHSEVCEYLYCSEMTEERAIWVTKRRNLPREISRTFTIDDAKKLNYIVDGKKQIVDKYGNTKTIESKENWVKQPSVMLQWRACTQLIRQVYPDVINGMYSVEEIQDF